MFVEIKNIIFNRKRAGELMEQLEIAELRQRKPYELSSGQRQRVAITRALAKIIAINSIFAIPDIVSGRTRQMNLRAAS